MKVAVSRNKEKEKENKRALDSRDHSEGLLTKVFLHKL